MRTELELDENSRGIVVLDIEADSSAEKKGLMVGDIIVEVGQQPVETPQQFEEQLKLSINKGRTAALLLIKRGQQELFIALPVE